MMDIGMYGSDHTSHPTGYHHHHHHHHQNSMDMNAAASTGYGYYPSHHHYPHQHHISLAHNTELLSGYANIQNNSNNNSNNNSSTPNTTPTSTTSSNNSSSMYHPHLYSPVAAEYGITTSNGSPSEQSYYENTDANVIHSFYNNQTTPASVDSQQQQHSPSDSSVPQMSVASQAQHSQINNVVPDTHIISSDNGLSYTNLDYMYGHSPANAMYMSDDKSSISLASQAFNAANPPNLSDSNIVQSPHHVSTTTMITTASAAAWHSHQHHHQSSATNYLDSSSMDAHQLGLTSMSCLQTQAQLNQMRGSVVHALNSGGHNQQVSDAQQQTQQGRNTQQPTYKWMQVKRNVPKPQGRYSLSIPC